MINGPTIYEADDILCHIALNAGEWVLCFLEYFGTANKPNLVNAHRRRAVDPALGRGPYLNDILPFSLGLKPDMALLTEGKLELHHRTKVTLLYNIERLRYA